MQRDNTRGARMGLFKAPDYRRTSRGGGGGEGGCLGRVPQVTSHPYTDQMGLNLHLIKPNPRSAPHLSQAWI